MVTVFWPARQIAAVVESSEGTQVDPSTIAVTDLFQTIDPQIQLTPNPFPRALMRRGHGVVPSHFAKGTATLTFGMEMAGSTANASSLVSIPRWSRLLEACGAVAKEVGGLGTGAITSGPIQHGETITATVGGNTAVALGYSYTGDNPITIEKAGAALAAGGATVSQSGSTFTITGSGAALGNVLVGWAWHPKTVESANKSLTFLFNVDGQRYQMYGARGTFTLSANVHGIPIAQFTFQGIFDEVDASALLSELGATALPVMIPPAFVNAASTLTPRAADGTYGTAISAADLCYDTFTFDAGVQVGMRKCANSADGWLAATVNGRAPTFTFNPDDPGTTAYQYVNKLFAGTQARGYLQWGSGASGNNFRLKLPHLETSALTMQERETRKNFSPTFNATLGKFDGASDNTVGHDNEWLLIHF